MGIALTDHLRRWGMKICPIDRSLKIMGQRYALHIMRNMILLKQNRFNQFLNSVEGINGKTLTIRLQQLEKYGLVERKLIPGKPAHTEYYPTEKGMAVQRILAEIASFSAKYEPMGSHSLEPGIYLKFMIIEHDRVLQNFAFKMFLLFSQTEISA
jgi:DNA-binding HxlR family transcriptional regulator